MANAALYFHDGLRPQPLPVHKPLSGIRIHREVPDLKRRKILEEMAAVRWRDAQVTQSRLYDHPGSGDLIPCNWDSEPWVVRPPTTNPDEQIWCAVLAQPPIEVGNALDRVLAARAFKQIGVYYHHVAQVFDTAVPQHL